MQTKQVSLLETKADGQGSFTALASVFGNEDLQGDRVIKGAFKGTIKRMREAGKVLPIVSSHKHDDPRFTIGTAKPDDLRETDKGLEVKGQLDLDNPIAAQVHRLFKSGAWTGWSFGFTTLDEEEGKDGVNELRELDLIEAGPCLKGANPEAQLQEAKSALAEAVENDPKAALLDPDTIALSPEAIIAGDELKGAQEGLMKAVWTTAYINDLPDSAFLYIESGGEKDSDGKTTPRSLRHFPYKDASGSVDLPHLRNALARIPQSSLSQAIKDRLTARAQSLLEGQSSHEPERKAETAKPRDPLKDQLVEGHINDLRH